MGQCQPHETDRDGGGFDEGVVNVTWVEGHTTYSVLGVGSGSELDCKLFTFIIYVGVFGAMVIFGVLGKRQGVLHFEFHTKMILLNVSPNMEMSFYYT